MFVLTDQKTGGVYAVRDDNTVDRVVQIFVDKDDAVRYYEMLKDNDYPRKLRIKFMEEDDGKDFFMVNFLDYNESPETMPATGKGASSSNLMNYYMEYMYPEMFKRASHPVFFSDVFFPAMDIVSAEGMEDWDNVAFVRYRSRKDMLEIGLNPIFDERHLYKIEALDKTIAIPVETPFLNDLRFILFFLLLTLGLVIDRTRTWFYL